MNDLSPADRIAADLVAKCYGKQGVLACVVRIEDGEIKVIAPLGYNKELALMLYGAADALAVRAPALPG